MATTTTPEPAAADLPSWKSDAYRRMQDDWQLCRDFFAGTRAIHAAGETYLPRFEGESQRNYDRRRTSTRVYNAFKRTIRALTGMVCQRPPTFGKDMPQEIRDHWEHIDGVNHGKVFVHQLLTDGLTAGLNGILVDYPTVEDPSRVTLADERRLGLRPYWVHIRAEDVMSVRVTRVGSREVFTLLVIRECTEVPAGLFGATTRVRYRVYRNTIAAVDAPPVTFELWEERAGDDGKASLERIQDARPVLGANSAPLQEIPFAPFFAGEPAGPFEAPPPLLDLAELNCDHYRVSADRRNAITLACTPTPVITGVVDEEDGKPLALGPTEALKLRDPNAKAFWLELTGTAFAPTKEELEMIERHMGAVGVAFLYAETRAAETARSKELDANAQTATLSRTVDRLEDTLERAAEFHAWYLGVAPGSVGLNRDFLTTIMAPDMVARLSDMEARGQLSLETLLRTVQKGNVLPEDLDVEDEVSRVALSGRNPNLALPDPGDAGGDRTTDQAA